MNDHQLEKFIEEIKQLEGYREEIYLDTQEKPTCGWGHYLKIGSKVPKEICELFLAQDIASVINNFDRIDKKLRDKLNPVRRRVICNMIFNLGLRGTLNFKKMWKAINDENWDQAASEMLDSKWAQQVGHRAFRLANLMREGKEGI